MSRFLFLIIKCGELAFKDDAFETMHVYNDSPLSLDRKERENIGLFKVHKVKIGHSVWVLRENMLVKNQVPACRYKYTHISPDVAALEQCGSERLELQKVGCCGFSSCFIWLPIKVMC